MLIVDYDYLEDVFYDKEINFIHDNIERLLWHALDDSEKEIIKIEMVSEKEKQRILNEFNDWSSNLTTFRKSWIEFITQKYGKVYGLDNQIIYWSKPERWDKIFRDLLRQTCNINFLTKQWGDKSLSKTRIPLLTFKEEFKFGL